MSWLIARTPCGRMLSRSRRLAVLRAALQTGFAALGGGPAPPPDLELHLRLDCAVLLPDAGDLLFEGRDKAARRPGGRITRAEASRASGVVLVAALEVEPR